MWKPNGTERRYKITKPGAKFARAEDRDGKPHNALYSGFDARNAHLPSEVLLTPAAAEKLKPLLRLVEVPNVRERIVVQPAPAEPQAAADAGSDVDRVDVPANWASLPAVSRKALAAQIKGSEVERARDADSIIEAYLKDR